LFKGSGNAIKKLEWKRIFGNRWLHPIDNTTDIWIFYIFIFILVNKNQSIKNNEIFKGGRLGLGGGGG
jgi:hypothetical protein